MSTQVSWAPLLHIIFGSPPPRATSTGVASGGGTGTGSGGCGPRLAGASHDVQAHVCHICLCCQTAALPGAWSLGMVPSVEMRRVGLQRPMVRKHPSNMEGLGGRRQGHDYIDVVQWLS